MKHLQLIGLIACAAFFVSCESTETASDTHRTAKHQKAKNRAAQEDQGQPDEAQQNLWQAQRDINNRDGAAARRY